MIRRSDLAETEGCPLCGGVALLGLVEQELRLAGKDRVRLVVGYRCSNCGAYWPAEETQHLGLVASQGG